MAMIQKNFSTMPEWEALTGTDRRSLSRVSSQRRYQPGQTIFHQDDACRGVYLMLKGLVSLHRRGADGSVVTLRLARQGDILGYRPILAAQPHMASADVVKACAISFFPTSHVKDILSTNKDFGMALLRREARELGEAEVHFQETVTQQLRSRLLNLLLGLNGHYGTEQPGGDILIELPISRQEMASMLGVRVETLSREIRHLTDDGLVKFSGHRAWLKDLPAIKQEVAPSWLRS